MTAEALEIQCEKILKKLKAAKSADANQLAFGASTHRYGIGKPISNQEVNEFQEKYGVVLPVAYRTFLTKVANGNKIPHVNERNIVNGCCAGPYYGLFPLGKYLSIGDNIVLSRLPTMGPNMPSDKWEEITARVDDPNLSDEQYEAILDEVFSGILPIGHQGCSGWQGIVLTGDYTGRVVYLDEELNGPPKFTRYGNFLDWYESWLDGVISGRDQSDEFEGTVYLSR